ncbi:MAG: sigma-70 family RNA polymerase sigma factor [bacterium]
MGKDLLDNHCPLRLLDPHGTRILPTYKDVAELDQSVLIYQAAPESERCAIRAKIFFSLSPFLLKSLSWYCKMGLGCGRNCKVGDLLSTAYVLFTDLIDKFDFSRNLNFLGYIVRGLSWGVFNSYAKESRFYRRHILSLNRDGGSTLLAHSGKNEEYWLSAIDLERLLSNLDSPTRDWFLMYHVFGYSFKDLAALTDEKAKTVQKAVERARKKIQAEQLLQ